MNNRFSPDRLSRSIRRAILFCTVGVSLLRVLILFPLTQIALANSTSTVASSVIETVSSFFTQAGLFVTLGLMIYLIYHAKPVGFLLSCQCLSLVFIAILLQAGVFWLLAFLDEAILSLPFSLSNYSLSQVESQMLAEAILSALFGILPALLIIFVCFATTHALYQKARRSGLSLTSESLSRDPRSSPLRSAVNGALAVYLIVCLINLIVETVWTIAEYHNALTPGAIPDLVSPYIFLLIYAIFGYILLNLSVCLRILPQNSR